MQTRGDGHGSSASIGGFGGGRYQRRTVTVVDGDCGATVAATAGEMLR